jgi:hypothetical protein
VERPRNFLQPPVEALEMHRYRRGPVITPKDVLQAQLEELEALLEAAGFRGPYEGTDKRDARRLVEALSHTRENASAVRVMVNEPEGSRALVVALGEFNNALHGILEWNRCVPEPPENSTSPSRYGTLLAVLQEWIGT